MKVGKTVPPARVSDEEGGDITVPVGVVSTAPVAPPVSGEVSVPTGQPGSGHPGSGKPLAGQSALTPEPPAFNRLYRSREDRLVAGVTGGLAAHLRLPATIVRIALILLTVAFTGLGAALYIGCWLFVPLAPPGYAPASTKAAGGVRGPGAGRRDLGQFVAYAALAAGSVIVAIAAGWFGNVVVLLSLLVAAVGAGVMWQRAGADERRRWVDRLPAWLTSSRWINPLSTSNRVAVTATRVLIGLALVAVGLIGLLAAAGEISVIRDGFVFGSVLVGGLVVVMSPLLWRMFAELRAERAERIRSQERADVAAMIHDQVLHTLALIQRNAHDDREVSRLARGQERELRSWLYQGKASPNERFKAALEAAAAEVEDTYAVTVDAVIVGDCAVDEHLLALVQASREAMVNAGKHAKVSTVSLYAEVEPGTDGSGKDLVSVFVRDRGVGFDPSQVAPDRHGLSGSIIDRMERHGGTAALRATPGEGTEVRLTMRTATRTADDDG